MSKRSGVRRAKTIKFLEGYEKNKRATKDGKKLAHLLIDLINPHTKDFGVGIKKDIYVQTKSN